MTCPRVCPCLGQLERNEHGRLTAALLPPPVHQCAAPRRTHSTHRYTRTPRKDAARKEGEGACAPTPARRLPSRRRPLADERRLRIDPAGWPLPRSKRPLGFLVRLPVCYCVAPISLSRSRPLLSFSFRLFDMERRQGISQNIEQTWRTCATSTLLHSQIPSAKNGRS